MNIAKEYTEFKLAILAGTYDLTEEIAFSDAAVKMPPYKWVLTFMCEWPDLQFAVARLEALVCSASPCEHSWSVEGWIHSKKRNRLLQGNAFMLLRAHTNLQFGKVREKPDTVLPWDIEMIIEDPEDAGSEDEDAEDEDEEDEDEEDADAEDADATGK